MSVAAAVVTTRRGDDEALMSESGAANTVSASVTDRSSADHQHEPQPHQNANSGTGNEIEGGHVKKSSGGLNIVGDRAAAVRSHRRYEEEGGRRYLAGSSSGKDDAQTTSNRHQGPGKNVAAPSCSGRYENTCKLVKENLEMDEMLDELSAIHKAMERLVSIPGLGLEGDASYHTGAQSRLLMEELQFLSPLNHRFDRSRGSWTDRFHELVSPRRRPTVTEDPDHKSTIVPSPRLARAYRNLHQERPSSARAARSSGATKAKSTDPHQGELLAWSSGYLQRGITATSRSGRRYVQVASSVTPTPRPCSATSTTTVSAEGGRGEGQRVVGRAPTRPLAQGGLLLYGLRSAEEQRRRSLSSSSSRPSSARRTSGTVGGVGKRALSSSSAAPGAGPTAEITTVPPTEGLGEKADISPFGVASYPSILNPPPPSSRPGTADRSSSSASSRTSSRKGSGRSLKEQKGEDTSGRSADGLDDRVDHKQTAKKADGDKKEGGGGDETTTTGGAPATAAADPSIAALLENSHTEKGGQGSTERLLSGKPPGGATISSTPLEEGEEAGEEDRTPGQRLLRSPAEWGQHIMSSQQTLCAKLGVNLRTPSLRERKELASQYQQKPTAAQLKAQERRKGKPWKAGMQANKKKGVKASTGKKGVGPEPTTSTGADIAKKAPTVGTIQKGTTSPPLSVSSQSPSPTLFLGAASTTADEQPMSCTGDGFLDGQGTQQRQQGVVSGRVKMLTPRRSVPRPPPVAYSTLRDGPRRRNNPSEPASRSAVGSSAVTATRVPLSTELPSSLQGFPSLAETAAREEELATAASSKVPQQGEAEGPTGTRGKGDALESKNYSRM